jgi:hypothetical protein
MSAEDSVQAGMNWMDWIRPNSNIKTQISKPQIKMQTVW